MNVFTSLVVTMLLAAAFSSANGQDLSIWFGTTSNNAGQEPGIYRASFNSENGDISKSELALALDGAGWITWHPKLPVLYSTANVNGKPAICAIKVAEDNSLSIAQTIEINDGSCFLTTDRDGVILISTQYGGGTVVSIPIKKDGSLGTEVQEIKHVGGSKVVKGRQNSPHPHYASISPDNRFVFVPDLGLDQLVTYAIDAERKKLVARDAPVNAIAGGGPRHMKFGVAGYPRVENRQFAFVLNELAMSVSIFVYDGNGGMELMHSVPTLTEEEQAGEVFNSGSEIRIHPSGQFVYTGNRGHDSISVFLFTTRSFLFRRIQVAPVHGAWPRNFNLTPDGKWLIAACRDSNSATVFSIDQKTGKLTYQRKATFVPGAICVSIR
jgi:6-phosphogluconolactonase